ncbi:MAG: MFS transporter [Pseudomonadota bacterium]
MTALLHSDVRAPRGAGARARLSWALYDWAAQPYFTVVLTFIFGPYFQNKVAPSLEKGQAWWGYGMAVAGLLVALTGPVLGAIADVRGQRKPWLLLANAMMVAGLMVTWIAVPGDTRHVVLILAGMALASLGSEYGVLFTNAMMPALAKPGGMGQLSGFGWGMGYIGGLLMLIFVLLFLALPETPLFGLDRQAHEPDRIVGPLAALWLVVFSLPLFYFVPDGPPGGPPLRLAARQGLGRLWQAARSLPDIKNIVLFLLSRMAYYDGVTAVYTFGGLYAAGTFAWELVALGAFGIILVVFGAVGVFVGGWADDRFGSKRTIIISIVGIALAVAGILSIERETVLWIVAVPPPLAEGGLFASVAEKVMIGFGCVAGFFLGPVQAASRTLMARLAPLEHMTAAFGLYALTGRATIWVAPALIGLVTDLSGSRRIGISMILLMLIAGLALLMPVRERRA